MNPRFSALLENYAKFDTVTLALACVALAAVLTGWLLARSGDPFGRKVYHAYLAFLALAFPAVTAGCLYLSLAPTP